MTSRAQFRRLLTGDEAVLVPLALDPLTARLCEQLGYRAVYVSGGALGYQLAVSEALLSVTELAEAVRAVRRRSGAAVVVDGGVGFGDPVHVVRAVWEFEAAGAAAVELEDQVAPKRVSHHRGIEHLVGVEEMEAKIRAAAGARVDADFLIIARTGAVRHEGFEEALERGRRYAAAGADLVMLFPETEAQWQAAPAAIPVPLAAMSVLGTRSAAAWAALGWRVVIDPFTGQVVAMDAIREAYARAQRGEPAADAGPLFERYRALPALAGLDELYAIEDVTTEQGRP